jgi:hypothetical protein
MFRSIAVFAVFFALLLISSAARGESGKPLADAVDEFNEKAQKDSIGKEQPPLTEDEVIAAIRGWDQKQTPVSDKVYKTYRLIADSKMLPEGATLTFTTKWSNKDFNFDVWRVDLNVKTGPQEGFTCPIRDRKLRSRIISTSEDRMRFYPPPIDAKKAGKLALEEFDADKDGKISGEEFDKVPSLKSNLKRLDADGDGAVTAEEITERIKFWQDVLRVGRMAVHCTVLHNGEPLSGAEVKFVPEKFLGKYMKVAKGTTGPNGLCRLSIPLEGPDDPPGLPPGFYRVEITKPGEKIPAKYNTATTLGVDCLVDNEAVIRGIRFDLKY